MLIGTAYWRPLHDLLMHLAAQGAIDARDLDLLLLTDSVSEALGHIQRYAVDKFRLRPRDISPSPLLGEPGALEPHPAAAAQET